MIGFEGLKVVFGESGDVFDPHVDCCVCEQAEGLIRVTYGCRLFNSQYAIIQDCEERR